MICDEKSRFFSFTKTITCTVPLPHLWQVSDLKACLDYCEDLARICENLNFFLPKQNRSKDGEGSVVSLIFLRDCLIFLSSMSFRQIMDRKL